MSNNKQENFKDTIIIDDSLGDVITISSTSQYLDDNYTYKLSPDGKVIISIPRKLKDVNSKEILINELIEYGFEKIPVELTETQLKDILGFSISKMAKNTEHGQIQPFSVEKVNNGDLTIILLMNNSNTYPFALPKLPIKLKDANEKVIFTDLVDLNKVISPEKIGIYYIKINKEFLKDDNMDLSTWTITFQL